MPCIMQVYRRHPADETAQLVLVLNLWTRTSRSDDGLEMLGGFTDVEIASMSVSGFDSVLDTTRTWVIFIAEYQFSVNINILFPN